MSRYQTSKSSLFLLEIIIDLFIFAFLCAYGLMFFIKSSNLTTQTSTLHQAAKITSGVANIYESSNGSLDAILEEYVTGSETENGIVLYFDESYVPCTEAEASYLCMVTKQDTALSKIQVDFCDAKATPLYSIEASCYTPLTPSSFREGAGL